MEYLWKLSLRKPSYGLTKDKLKKSETSLSADSSNGSDRLGDCDQPEG